MNPSRHQQQQIRGRNVAVKKEEEEKEEGEGGGEEEEEVVVEEEEEGNKEKCFKTSPKTQLGTFFWSHFF